MSYKTRRRDGRVFRTSQQHSAPRRRYERFEADVPPFTESGGDIPERYTEERPRVTWDEPPKGTKSFAVVMDDPDAPDGDFVHWSAYNIPASARSIEEGDLQGAEEGVNSYGVHGYAGPAPPPGETHTYEVTVYALDTAQIDSPQEIMDHELGKSTIKGKFSG